MNANIVAARSLLDATLDATPEGFHALWFRHERIGAIGALWLPHLDPLLFNIERESGLAAVPQGGHSPVRAIRVRGSDRRSEGGLVATETLNRRFADWAFRLKTNGLLPGWRGEPMQLYGNQETTPLLAVERGLLRPLGLLLRSIQVNVYSQEGEQLRIWVAQRADSKSVDPGCFDSLVGGGVGGDETPLETLVRECAEEAGINRALARRAVPVGIFDSSAVLRDGFATVLHRERLTLFDLKVPVDFQPALIDGETQSVRCLAPDAVLKLVGSSPWSAEGAWATTDLIRRRAPQLLAPTNGG